MIDVQIIRDNPDLVKQKVAEKGYKVDIDKFLEFDNERRSLIGQIDEKRRQINEHAAQFKQTKGTTSQENIDKGKVLKVELSEIENYLKETETNWQNILWSIPNLQADDVPVGDESQNQEISKFGENKTSAEDHQTLAERKGWLDFDRGAKVAGSKFYYLRGDLALLENAIFQYALNFVSNKGFQFLTVPHMVNANTITGTGFAPRTSDQTDEYHIENEDLSLIATAEIPLTGYHSGEIIDEDKLPLLYCAYSPCYRKEAGTYGKHTRGLYRVHQFNKLELYVFCLPEQSGEIHEEILNIEKELWESLNIPFRVVNIASGDLGAPAHKKYDIEYWSPVDQNYRELTSCSNCTDFQARNLNIKVRRADGNVEFANTLNGTAVALARSLVAILENYQTPDGDVILPEVLRVYMGGRERI